MLLAVLQVLLKFIFTLGAIFGLVFMMVCTVLAIVCAIRGDIRINIVKNKTDKEKKKL